MKLSDKHSMDVLASFCGLLQIVLGEAKMLDSSGNSLPKKKLKEATLEDMEVLWLYEWSREKTKYLSQSQLTAIGVLFNKASHALSDVYEVDNTLLGLYYLRKWVDENASSIEQNLLSARIDRTISTITLSLIENFGEDVGREISRHSAYSGDNLYRIISGRKEIPLKERAAVVSAWRKKCQECYGADPDA